ncbi:MAG TPA: T9SS type A sorting domain-containing protein [Bacteroidia bacterium]|nr:T9SS type A sorting domain-containing protein [Bacteroidia bacterium]
MKKIVFITTISLFLVTTKVNSQCSGPTAVSILDLNPTEVQVYPNQVSSIQEWGPPGYTPGTGASAGAGGTLFNCLCSTPVLENLIPGTTYDFYCRYYCGSFGYSANTPKLTFTTPPCPETFTYGALGSTTSFYFGGTGYYSWYAPNGSPVEGAERIVKFTPSSSGYYDLKVSRPYASLYSFGAFLIRQVGPTCNFILDGNMNGYSSPEFYTDTVAASMWNYYYRIGPLTSGITYDLFFDSNDTTYDITNQQDVSLSFIGCSSTPYNAYSSFTTICAGESTTLTQYGGILAAGGSYKWYSGSCGGTLVGTGSSISVSPNTTTTYYVRGEAPCGNSTCKSITITVINAAVIPSGNITNCGGQVTLSTPYLPFYGNFTTYQWKKNGVDIPNANSISYSPNTSGSYTVQTSSLSCTAVSPQPANVTITLPAVITASGPTVLCPGGSVVLTADSGMTGLSFNWYIDGAYSGSSQSITATTTGKYSCTIYTGASCFNYPTPVQVVVGMSTAPIYPASAAATCAGSSVTLSVPSSAGLTYHWKLNGTNIPGATNYNYPATSAGSYTVNISNGMCSGTTSTAKTVTVNPLPAVNVTANGSTTFCDGANVYLNATPTGNYFYQWKKSGSNIFHANGNYYAATTAGSFTVTMQDTYGCRATSSSVVTTVNPSPNPAITAGGPTSFCAGGSVTLSAPAPGNRAYQWHKNFINISGATASSYVATESGTYRVSVTNTLTGCTKSTTNGTVVTKKAVPPATITPQGPTTFCAGGNVVLQANTGSGFSYKWKKGSNYISGATLSSYTAAIAGTYRIEITKTNGCSKTSSGVVVTVPCKEGESVPAGEEEKEFAVNVFPNPSSGDFVFNIENANDEKIAVSIYNIIGELILSESFINPQFIIRNPQLSPGIYSAVVTGGENRKVLKLIKTE